MRSGRRAAAPLPSPSHATSSHHEAPLGGLGLIAARMPVVPLRPGRPRRSHQLRGHPRDQHGAALPRGDLVLVRSQGSYRVGQIVAYHSRVFHTVVLHRIIGRAGNRYIFKGDNNNFVDFEHPEASQLIGALWLHVPGAGARPRVAPLAGARRRADRARARCCSPARRSPAAGAARQGAARAAEPAPGAAPAAPPRGPPRRVAGRAGLGLAALFPFVVLALLAFTRPVECLEPATSPYKQSGALSYCGDRRRARPTPATVPDRRTAVHARRQHRRAPLRLPLPQRHAPLARRNGRAGRDGRLDERLADQARARRPSASTATARAHRGPRPGLAAGAGASVEKGTDVGGAYTLTLSPHVSASGRLGGDARCTRRSLPPSAFSLNQLEVQPVPPQAARSPAGRPALRSPPRLRLCDVRGAAAAYLALGPRGSRRHRARGRARRHRARRAR